MTRWTAVIAVATILGRHAREASQRPHGLDVECGSYERATGTVVTDRRARGLVFAPSGATFSRDGPGCSRAYGIWGIRKREKREGRNRVKSFRIQTVALGGHQPQRTHSAPRAPRRQSDQIPRAVFMGREARFSIVVAWRSRAKNLLGEAFSGGPIASRHSTIFSSLRSPSGSCSGRSSGRGRSARQWRSRWLRPPHIPGNPSRTRAKAATRWRLAHTAP